MRYQQWGGVDWTNVLVRMPVDVKEELTALALRKDTSQTMLINEAIYRYLQADRALAQDEHDE